MSRDLTIGRPAKAAGVNVETIRYYQRRGLMPEPPRSPGSYRTYDRSTVERLRFIERAQQLGFTLREVGELLDLGDGACQEVQELATAKLAEIEDRLRDLTHMWDILADHLAAYREGEADGGCPLVRILGRTVEQNRNGPHPDKDGLLQRSGED